MEIQWVNLGQQLTLWRSRTISNFQSQEGERPLDPRCILPISTKSVGYLHWRQTTPVEHDPHMVVQLQEEGPSVEGQLPACQ